jgi:hypothetical protein
MRQWFTERSGRLARLASVGTSVLLILIIVSAGWIVIPHGITMDSGEAYRQAGQTSGAGPRVVPVFVMRPDHSVVRHGTALLEAGGRVSVNLFASTASEEPQATDALLFEPTVAVLWAVAPEKARAELKQRFEDTQQQLGHSVEALITSDVFTNLYRPVLRSILTDSVTRAWEDAKTQSAFAELLATSDSAFKDKLGQGMEAIVLSRVKDAVWDMLESNWLNAFGLPLGYDLDYTPVTRAVATTLLDPRLQQTLVQFGSERLGTSEARRLAESIVVGAVEALMSDRRIPDVLSAMLWDPRLRDLVHPFTGAALGLGAALPRDLGGLGATSTLNPLAAHVFKAVLLGQHTPLILFVTPEERSRIERLAPDAAKQLRPVAAGDAT